MEPPQMWFTPDQQQLLTRRAACPQAGAVGKSRVLGSWSHTRDNPRDGGCALPGFGCRAEACVHKSKGLGHRRAAQEACVKLISGERMAAVTLSSPHAPSLETSVETPVSTTAEASACCFHTFHCQLWLLAPAAPSLATPSSQL